MLLGLSETNAGDASTAKVRKLALEGKKPSFEGPVIPCYKLCSMDAIIRVLLIMIARLWPLTSSWHSLQDRLRGTGKADWPKVKGGIHSCILEENRYTWKATVVYYYSAYGDYWSGETSRVFFREDEADNYAHMLPVNSSVIVRTCPSKPGKSVVLAEDQMQVYPKGSI